MVIEKNAYRKLREAKKCVKCRQQLTSDRSLCECCGIKSIWASIRTVALRNGYEPINVDTETFVSWYQEKRISCNGLCEWCGEPFGIRGPVTDHDHSTGELRALICSACNLAEGAGLDRLKRVVRALEIWNEKAVSEKTALRPLQERVPLIQWSFRRWAKYIMSTRKHREKRMVKVIDEIRERSFTTEIFEKNYAAFREYLDGQEQLLYSQEKAC